MNEKIKKYLDEYDMNTCMNCGKTYPEGSGELALTEGYIIEKQDGSDAMYVDLHLDECPEDLPEGAVKAQLPVCFDCVIEHMEKELDKSIQIFIDYLNSQGEPMASAARRLEALDEAERREMADNLIVAIKAMKSLGLTRLSED